MDQVKIGELIATLRKENKMTQKQLAEKLGVTDRAISKWENGRGMPETSSFKPLAEALGVSVNELLSGERINTAEENSFVDTSETLPETKESVQAEPDDVSAIKAKKTFILKYGIIACAAVVVAVSIFLIIFLNRPTTVPDVTGKTLLQATSLMEEVGFKVEKVMTHSDTVQRTFVISQEKEGGKRARHGSKITLVISSGKEQISLPDLKGKTRDEAENELKKLGFAVSVSEIFSSTVEKGKVAAQSVAAGTKAEKGSKIIVSISNGPDYVTVPSIKGMTLEKSEEILKEAGLELVTEIAFSSSVAEGRIISQDTPANEQAIRGSAISAKLSAGVANTKGTTPSNANHFGHITTQGNWIYFCGSDNAIYRMRKDGSQTERICHAYPVSLNVIGEWIYYVDGTNEGGIYKIKIDGTGQTKISHTTSYKMYVEGDWIYYTDDWNVGKIYKMKTDGSEITQITSEICNEFIVSGGYIYYVSRADNMVYKCRTDGKGKTLVCAGFGGMDLSLTGGMLAVTKGYDILTVKLDGSGFKSFGTTNIQCSMLNGNDGWLYYIQHDFRDGDEKSALCRVRPDGSGKTVIYEYEYPHKANAFINVADGWIYFEKSQVSDDLYRVRTNGTDLQRVG